MIRRLLSAVAGATLVLSLTATVAGATATLTGPVSGSTVTTVHPTLVWTLGAGDTAKYIEVADASAISGGGYFTSTNFSSKILAPTETFWTPTGGYSLPQGKWYWHVRTEDAMFVSSWSSISNFTVRPIARIHNFTARFNNRGSYGSFIVSGNSKRMGIRVRVYVGQRRCMNKATTFNNSGSLLDTRSRFTYKCYPGGRRIPVGTKIRVYLTTVAGDATVRAYRSKRLR